MEFFLDIRLPIGINIKTEVRHAFNGIIRSFLNEVLKDLEENTNKHTTYFLRERLKKDEKKLLIVLLQEVLEEKRARINLTNESYQEQPQLDLNYFIEKYHVKENPKHDFYS